MDMMRFILAVAVTGIGWALLLSTALRTMFPRGDGWYVPTAVTQYAAGLACLILGSALLGWL